MSEALQGQSFGDEARFSFSLSGTVFQDPSDVDQYITLLK